MCISLKQSLIRGQGHGLQLQTTCSTGPHYNATSFNVKRDMSFDGCPSINNDDI